MSSRLNQDRSRSSTFSRYHVPSYQCSLCSRASGWMSSLIYKLSGSVLTGCVP